MPNVANKKKENKKSKERSCTGRGEDVPVSRSKNKSWGELLQQRRCELWDDSLDRRRRSRSNREGTRKESFNHTGTIRRSSSKEMEGENGNRIAYEFTLQEIKDSIPLDVLKSICENNFKPNELVIIKKEQKKNKFLEDLYFSKKTKKKTPSKKIKKLPSKMFENDIPKNDDQEITIKGILGVYFKLYKKLFKEEDSEWNSKNIQRAIMTINSLLEDTGTSKIEVMSYVKRILPLWYDRLINEENFPNRRPAIILLFGGKRWYWSNRKLLYRQWG